MRLTFWTLSYNVLICSLNFSRMTISTESTGTASQLSIGCLFAYLWVYYFSSQFFGASRVHERSESAIAIVCFWLLVCGHLYFWILLLNFWIAIDCLSAFYHIIRFHCHTVSQCCWNWYYWDVHASASAFNWIESNRIELNRALPRNSIGTMRASFDAPHWTLSPRHLFRSPLYFNLSVCHSYHEPSKI